MLKIIEGEGDKQDIGRCKNCEVRLDPLQGKQKEREEKYNNEKPNVQRTKTTVGIRKGQLIVLNGPELWCICRFILVYRLRNF